MCRFVLYKSKNEKKPEKLLDLFAQMCEKSKTLEGFHHEDGWGISWWGKSSNKWLNYKSLKPVWQDKHQFPKFKAASIFLFHARSASFASQKGKLVYNQPLISDTKSFVFNGMLYGVRMPVCFPGFTGAEKIWSICQEYLQSEETEKALRKTYQQIVTCTKKVKACNIGISDGRYIYALQGENISEQLFSLQVYQDHQEKIICSEKIGSYDFQPMKKGELLKL